MSLGHFAKMLFLFPCFALVCLALDEPEPALHVKPGADTRSIQVTANLPAELAQALPGELSQEQGEKLLQVFLRNQGKEGPPLFGKYEKQGKTLMFQPGFLLDPGETYGIKLTLPKKIVIAEYKVPPLPKGPAPVVEKIYPTGDVLPANHLKWYIYFSQPMRGGEEIFSQIEILDENGNPVDEPWLMDELWSKDGKMLIIYIHPGRIKWGILLRELLGPVLYPNRQYTLRISSEMRDERGQKLGKDVLKKFRTIDEDRTHIDLTGWKIVSPKADSKEPMTLQLPKIIDHKSLDRFLTVVNPAGKAVTGKGVVGPQEKSWAFYPDQSWQAIEYTLKIDEQLEDVAGNTPRRPFDLDLKVGLPPPQKLEKNFQPLGSP